MKKTTIETLNDKNNFVKINYNDLKSLSKMSDDFKIIYFSTIKNLLKNVKLNIKNANVYFCIYDCVEFIIECENNYFITFNEHHSMKCNDDIDLQHYFSKMKNNVYNDYLNECETNIDKIKTMFCL